MADQDPPSADATIEAHQDTATPAPLQVAREEASKMRERNVSLLGMIALVEENAQRLGIDPEELYKPLDRSTSKDATQHDPRLTWTASDHSIRDATGRKLATLTFEWLDEDELHETLKNMRLSGNAT